MNIPPKEDISRPFVFFWTKLVPNRVSSRHVIKILSSMQVLTQHKLINIFNKFKNIKMLNNAFWNKCVFLYPIYKLKSLSLTEASRNNVVTCPGHHLAFLSWGTHSQLNHWSFISVERWDRENLLEGREFIAEESIVISRSESRLWFTCILGLYNISEVFSWEVFSCLGDWPLIWERTVGCPWGLLTRKPWAWKQYYDVLVLSMSHIHKRQW